MKRILITGAESYVGTSFEKWVSKWPDKYAIDTIDVKRRGWKEKSFRGYDVVFHVAAIVHKKEMIIENYFKINRDLALDVARKAKDEKVKQFIFLSTMGVYGIEVGYIEEKTAPNPKTPYAKSKLEAEKQLAELEDNVFKVAILRSPMVYGKNCLGNYPRLTCLALKLPVFPLVKNERSMIYIDNLSEFVRLLIENEVGGLFFPQNKDYINTTELAALVAKTHEKELKIIKFINIGISFGQLISMDFRKVFGSLTYAKEMPGGPGTEINGIRIDYETVTFEQSIKLTEM